MTRPTIQVWAWLAFMLVSYAIAGTVDFQTVAGR